MAEFLVVLGSCYCDAIRTRGMPEFLLRDLELLL